MRTLNSDPDPLADCPFRFQTRVCDPETGLYCFGCRYYDPLSCKWLSRDPKGEAGGVNLTAYCENDPVNNHDPLGLDPWNNTQANDLTQVDTGLWFLHPQPPAPLPPPPAFNVWVPQAASPVDAIRADDSDAAYAFYDATCGQYPMGSPAAENMSVGPLKAVQYVVCPPSAYLDIAMTMRDIADPQTPPELRAMLLVGLMMPGPKVKRGPSIATRERIMCNIRESQEARKASKFAIYGAKDRQIQGGYKPDVFKMVTLPRGTFVCGGDPISGWFSDLTTLKQSNLSQTTLWNSLQVPPNETFGPRMSVTVSVLTEEVSVPAGFARNNPGWGDGWGWQFYLQTPRARNILQPVVSYELH